MDRTSNSPFEPVCSQTPFLDGYSLVAQSEFEWLTKSTDLDKTKLPTKKEVNRKVEEMTKLSTAIITEVKLPRVPILDLPAYTNCRATSARCLPGSE